MFSVDNFYEYLSYRFNWPIKNSIIYAFTQRGSRNLFDLRPRMEFDDLLPLMKPYNISSLFGAHYLFDDEPILFNYYHFGADTPDINKLCFKDEDATIIDQISVFFSRMRTPFICHSECNSDEINELKERGFKDIHYWYHGLISLDWFRHWKFYNLRFNPTGKRFGLYARDTSGSRKYRLDLLHRLKKYNDQVYFTVTNELLNTDLIDHWPRNPANIPSTASAFIDVQDCNNFQIHLVAETLFNTKKIHLTEKTLKPIVMGQPFIIFSGPGSLAYLKKYGFKTFDSIWNESYDNIQQHEQRLDAILNLIDELYRLPDSEFKQLLLKASDIISYNQQHFYSDKFQQILISELLDQFENSFQIQHEEFAKDPGGMFFQQLHNMKLKYNSIGSYQIQINNILNYLKPIDPDSVKKIVRKYNHLF